MTIESFEESLIKLNPEFDIPEVKCVAQRISRKNDNNKTIVLQVPLALAKAVGVWRSVCRT